MMSLGEWLLKSIPHVVTEEETKLRWMGRRDRFRCYMCGKFWKAGDTIRSIYSNYTGSPFTGNPYICHSPCGDKTDIEVLEILAGKANVPWWVNF